MLAFQVLLAGGRYQSDGEEEFIVFEPRLDAPVLFTAFCADFDLDNPVASDQLVAGQLPEPLGGISQRIARYMTANPTADVAVAAQVALWMAQGIDTEAIQERFPFTIEERILANRLVAGAF